MRAIIAVTDLLAGSRLQQAARAAGYEVTSGRSVPPPDEPPPDVLVVDLDQPETMASLEAWCARHPPSNSTRVVAFAFHVHEDVMAQARGLGVEVVTHGATTRPDRLFR